MLTINIPINASRYELEYNKKTKILSGAFSGSTYNMNGTSIQRQEVIKLMSRLFSSFTIGETILIDDNGLVEVLCEKRVIEDEMSRRRYQIDMTQLKTRDNVYIFDIGYIPKIINFRETFTQYIRNLLANTNEYSYKIIYVMYRDNWTTVGKHINFKLKIDTTIATVSSVLIQKPKIYKEIDATNAMNKTRVEELIENTADIFKINTLNDILTKSICA